MQTLEFDDALTDSILATTEAAAIAASRVVGRGDARAVDGAAVRAMRTTFDLVAIDAVVVVGEGEKDQAPMLFAGERLGNGRGPALDIAVDPIDGTRLAAENLPDSISVLAASPRGSLFDPGPVFYMEKMVAAVPDAGLDLRLPMAENLDLLAAALGKARSELCVVIQERPRNALYFDAAREAGAMVIPFGDGDVVPAIRAAYSEGEPDLMIGIGGAPEGVLTASAVRSLRGHMQARLAPQTQQESDRAKMAGLDVDRVLSLDDLASADGYLFLTAVTDGAFLRGVITEADARTTESLVVEPSGEMRRVTHRHPRNSA
ncbi:class II fructose-bisphosphatase [Microbacterium sp. STN6]|uniref:class II fructose-bisphosphatase n=1 Tax=Microbacterium sp. STN6 TaxID=2995588 RepID=UPI00226097F3|nr:class II fructose-bisphosphatase [Microbacterium sp. STN6]MCX7521877.1 class II fructose-bisphosphatase [Microbacterium sp. STN6]